MQWECHSCGHQHANIPPACERCGTAPEIVRNVWRCQHCGAEGIGGDQASCPTCRADRALGVETAVDAGARVEGEQGRLLAAGPWLYCAYCDVQVPPVDASGQQNEVCPSCQGPLSEAEREAAVEELSADEAGQYRAEATQRRGAAPAPRPAPPRRKKKKVWPFIVIPIGVLVAGFCGLVIYFMIKGPAQFVVADRAWTCTVDVERFGPVQGEAWLTALPAKAYARRCSRAVHHYNRVPDGTERYSDKVASGRTCSSYGYKKRGGVSVKTCRSWKTTYRTVTKTRTRYRRVPIFRQRCRFTEDRWHTARKLTAQGSGAEEPRWPATDKLAAQERAGARSGVYTLSLRGEDETKPYTCRSLEEWKRFPLKSTVVAETAFSGQVTAIRRSEAE